MKKILFSLSLLVVACGGKLEYDLPERFNYGRPSEIVVDIDDQEIVNIVEEFYYMSSQYQISAVPVFIEVSEKVPDEVAGRCRWNGRKIRLHTAILEDTVDRFFMKYIIFHELGHCAHGEDHTEDISDLMHPSQWPTSLKDADNRILRYFERKSSQN